MRRKFARRPWTRQGQTLQAIASALAERGHINDGGNTFAAAQIARMCAIRG